MPDAQNSNPTNTVASPSADADATAAGTNRPTNSEFSLGAPAAPGEVGVLGPYRIVKELGKGGMGAVYLAVDTRLDRELALKVMLPAFAADPASKERFLREAKAVAKVAHDHVVTIFEADEREGVPYIAMQFLQGAPLDEYLKKKGSPGVAQCVRIVREAALGLAAAHARGLVHRDIKPANLWLEAPNGRVKVLDFGLAKPIGADSELTKSGAVVGTPSYMSPEQARGQKVDHRTDIFSLGAVLYRLLTGRNPFLGDHIMAVLTALAVEEPTPVRELNPNVPPALADFVNQLLAKKPEARPQTAQEVADRLRTVLSQPAADVSASVPVVVQPLPVPMQVSAVENAFANLTDDEEADDRTEREAEPVREPVAPKRGKGLLIAGGALALVAAVGVAIALGTGGKKPDGVAKQPDLPAPPAQPLGKKDADTSKPPPVAPKVECVAGRVWVAGATPKDALTLGHSTWVWGAAFSPDGTRVATGSGFEGKVGEAKVWDAKTGAELLVLKGHTDCVYAVAFSADGARLVTGSCDGLAKVWDAKTGTELFTLKGHTGRVRAARFSPNGTRIVTGSADNTAKVWDAKTGAVALTLAGHTNVVQGVSFSPDGARLVTGSCDGLAKVWDAKTGTELFTLKGHNRDLISAQFGPDGSQVVTASSDGTARVWDATTGAQVLSLGHADQVYVAALSADGARVVTGCEDKTVRVWDAKSGAELLALKGHNDRVFGASFSPDGTRIVTASHDQTAKVWDVRAPGGDLTPESATDWSKWWVAQGEQSWKLQDGKLMNGNSARGWIGTRTEYTDFELELEYKLGAKGNSGIFLRAWADGEINGSQFVEVQLIDDAGYKVSGLTGTGAVFKRVPPNPVPETKLNEWNRAIVRVAGKRVTVTINGTKCVDSDVEFPRAKGVIGLQQLDSPVEFRNVRVRDLSAIAANPERAAAEWALAAGGSVSVSVSAKDAATRVQPGEQLPGEPFQLKVVSLSGCKGATDDGLVHIAGRPALTHLYLHKTAVSDPGLVHLKGLKALIDLMLSDTTVSDAGLVHLAGLTDLQAVHLHGLAGVTDTGLVHLSGLGRLTFIDLRKTKVTAKGVADLAKALPKCKIEWAGGVIEPTAKAGTDREAAECALALGGNVGLNTEFGQRVVRDAAKLPAGSFHVTSLSFGANVTDADLSKLHGLTALNNLHLHGASGVTDAGLAHLAHSPALETLVVSDTKVTGTGLVHTPNLKQLQMAGTPVTDDGLKRVAELTQLTHLNLNVTRVTDAQLAHLKSVPNLAHLNLSDTPITDAGLEHLAGLSKLQSVHLKNAKVTDVGVKNLAAALPKCLIVWDGGTVVPPKK